MPYELCHARRQLLSAPVRISSCVSESLSVSVSYVQFICSYNFDDGVTQYRSLLYTVLSTLYPLPSSPQPLVSVLCCVSVVTYARWNHSVDTLSVCMRTHPEAPPTEAMRSGHKNFITYLFGPFNLSPYRDKPNNNNCCCLCNDHVIRHVDPSCNDPINLMARTSVGSSPKGEDHKIVTYARNSDRAIATDLLNICLID